MGGFGKRVGGKGGVFLGRGQRQMEFRSPSTEQRRRVEISSNSFAPFQPSRLAVEAEKRQISHFTCGESWPLSRRAVVVRKGLQGKLPGIALVGDKALKQAEGRSGPGFT